MKTLAAHARRLHVVAAGAALLTFAAVDVSEARELWTSEDGERSLRLESSLKASWLLSYAPDAPILFPERTSAATLWRLRLEPHAEPLPWLHIALAYEHRSRLVTSGAGFGGGAGVLPPDSEPPYRMRALDDRLVDIEPSFSHSHELDRAFVSFTHPAGEMTIGRQAIGWGRGILFSAVDIFSPFSPLEVDREWRRGVDAFRAEIEFHEQLSLEVVTALGHDLDSDESAFVGRLRGYLGDVDGEIIFGRRARDWMFATTLSARVGDAALHGELALFETPGDLVDDGLFGSERLVAKAVLGVSLNLLVGTGLRVFAEYHYSGFGLKDITTATTHLLDPAFQRRFLRGDTQILGRHALAVLGSYDLGDSWSVSLLWMQSPVDGSGLLSPSVTWDFAENVTLVANVFFPYGRGPERFVLRSEYGASPVTGFIQMRAYD